MIEEIELNIINDLMYYCILNTLKSYIWISINESIYFSVDNEVSSRISRIIKYEIKKSSINEIWL